MNRNQRDRVKAIMEGKPDPEAKIAPAKTAPKPRKKCAKCKGSGHVITADHRGVQMREVCQPCEGRGGK